MKKLFLLAIVAFSFTTVSFGQTNTATANASAKITTAISLVSTNDINFGAVIPSASIGTVTVTTTGSRSRTGGAQVTTGGGTVAAATFDVSGTPDQNFAITLPVSDLTVTNGGAGTMTVTAWACDLGASSTLDNLGSKTLKIGATLNVGVNQATGQYIGAAGFPVTVNYN